MLDFIRSWTINIVMLVLFIVIIEMLIPGGRKKKYVNLLTGTILIIAIIEPITGIFGKSFDFTQAQTVAAGNLDKKEIERAGRFLEEEHMRQTMELYRSRIIGQIIQCALEVEGVKDAKADIIINEDQDSEYFGTIKRIYIDAVVEGRAPEAAGSSGGRKTASEEGTAAEDDDSGGGNKISVDRIESIRTGGANWDDTVGTIYDEGLNRRLADRIGEVFGVGRENIVIKQMQR
jgi:stage III sporulation protein AF